MEQVKNRATVARLEMPKGGYENLTILRSILFEFIEEYRAANRYNRQRLHSNLKYEFPSEFETEYCTKFGSSSILVKAVFVA